MHIKSPVGIQHWKVLDLQYGETLLYIFLIKLIDRYFDFMKTICKNKAKIIWPQEKSFSKLFGQQRVNYIYSEPLCTCQYIAIERGRRPWVGDLDMLKILCQIPHLMFGLNLCPRQYSDQKCQKCPLLWLCALVKILTPGQTKFVKIPNCLPPPPLSHQR